MLRILSYSAAIAIAGCSLTPQEKDAIAKREAQQAYDDRYDRCISRVTGLFSAASIEVMRECDRQARTKRGEQ